MSRTTHRRMLAVLAGSASLIACALTAPAIAAAATWHGAFDSSAPTKLSFNYSRSHITKFTVPTVGCTSTTGYQVETIYIPSVAVRGEHFSITYHPPKTPPLVKVKLSGALKGSKASGKIEGLGLCDTGPQTFHANAGKFHPVHPPAAKHGKCTMSGCETKDGALIEVTGVDRTITSVADPANVYDQDADPNLTGGVAVTIAGVDQKAHDPFLEPGFSSFQLRLGSGKLIPAYGSNSTVVGMGGAKVPCSSPYDQQQLTRGAHYGPITVCFAVPSAADRQHLTLYYMPNSFDALAKIPLN